tara:strand:- start:42 stop:149 length:108 start_codon:yes stop_codon:yes gene_type:complete
MMLEINTAEPLEITLELVEAEVQTVELVELVVQVL